jgi:uncharacterized protein (UPF0335 family)
LANNLSARSWLAGDCGDVPDFLLPLNAWASSVVGSNRRAVNLLSVRLSGLTHWLFFCGHFRTSIYQGGTMSDVTIPGGKIRAFVERVENIDTELQELNEQKKEIFAEAKGEGFDVKILKEIIKLRKQDEEERDERESMLDLYMRAMEQAAPENVAKAA